MRSSSNEPLFAAIRTYLAAEYPGECCTEVRLILHRGRVVLAVPPATAPPSANGHEASAEADTAESGEEKYTLRDAIYELLLDAHEPLKASTIARRLGKKLNSYFHKILHQMTEDGDIKLDKDWFYSVTN